MRIEAEAIVCAVRPHGEHGAIVRALSADHGLLAGYVRGGRSRRLRPVLMPGNILRGEWRARTDEQLPALAVELVESRAVLLAEPLAAIAVEWITALTATCVPEALPYPRLHTALDGVLAAIVAAAVARDWVATIARYELLMLAELGFAIDLSGCAGGGAGPLAFVSPKTGAAVSAAAGEPYRHRLMPLPAFLLGPAPSDLADVLDALRITGLFLERDVIQGRAATIIPARERLIERLKRMA